MRSEQDVVQELVRTMYQSAEHASWDLTPEDIRAQRRRRVILMPDPKAIGLVAAALVLIVVGFFVFSRPTSHKSVAIAPATTTTTSISGRSVTVPTVVGLTQSQAASALGAAGLSVGEVAAAATSQVPAGRVISTTPSEGALVAPGSSVNLAVSSGPSGVGSSASTTAPTTRTPVTRPTAAASGSGTASTPPIQSTCASGNVAVSVTADTASTCVQVGSRLTVTFISLGWWSGYGHWHDSSPTISNTSILNLVSYNPSGRTATAVFSAVGTGTATAVAQFDVTCAPGDRLHAASPLRSGRPSP